MSLSGVIIVLSFIVVIMTFATMYIIFKYCRNLSTNVSNVSFEYLYSNKDYSKISSDSAKAGKGNSPFLQDDITVTMLNGSVIMNSIGNLFEGVLCDDSKPKW